MRASASAVHQDLAILADRAWVRTLRPIVVLAGRTTVISSRVLSGQSVAIGTAVKRGLRGTEELLAMKTAGRKLLVVGQGDDLAVVCVASEVLHEAVTFWWDFNSVIRFIDTVTFVDLPYWNILREISTYSKCEWEKDRCR